MTFNLGWYKRNEDKRRLKVSCALVRKDLEWKQKPARFERWEAMEPQPEDWDELLDSVERNYVRRKISPADRELITRLHKQHTSTKP
jgi:hypothetical protein|tara:strand:- start:1678 stop:1938 length:261 start_codon:yes stop_codon:yes gene_type:complete